MINRVLSFVIVVLAVMLSFQLVSRASRGETEEEPLRLLSGTPLTAVAGGALAPLVASRCLPIYFVDPTCPACRALAQAWERKGRQSAVWVVGGDAHQVEAFVGEFLLPPEEVISVRELGEAEAGFPALGIHAVPTSAVLDADGILQHVRVTAEPIAAETVADYCRESAARPQQGSKDRNGP